MKLIQAGKEAVNTIKDIDTVFNSLQQISGATDQQIDSLKTSYTDLAKELSATVTDIGKISEAWVRTGDDVMDEASMDKLIEATTIFQKTSGLSAEDSQKYLVAAMRGFEMTTDQVLYVADVSETLDKNAAVSASEIAEGLSRVASAAHMAGIEFETLSS